jgi:hypothetical protein
MAKSVEELRDVGFVMQNLLCSNGLELVMWMLIVGEGESRDEYAYRWNRQRV